MKIIILGAGQVGASLAASLASEANDITVVDADGDRLRELSNSMDIRTVQGHASHPNVLREAGGADADMLIAVTNSDEVNMVACQVAYTYFRTPTKIARVRSTNYFSRKGLFGDEGIPIEDVISPEQVVTNYVKRLIEHPGALQVLSFADGKAQLVGTRAVHGGPLVGNPLSAIRRHMPSVKTRVAAIFRRDRPIAPEGTTVIEAGDEVFFLAATSDIRAVMSELRRVEDNYKRIMIAGGGNIGERLAEAIETRYQVKVIERNPARARKLASSLSKAVVIQGVAADKQLLLEENIEDVDVFCALTNDDEANIMSAMLAKRLGARKTIALINNPAYVDLLQGDDIDIAFSPQQATLGTLLAKVRRGSVSTVHSLRRGAAEAIEIVAKGDRKASRVVGRRIEEIDLPEGCTIGAIVRKDEVMMGHDDLLIETEDHVILFVVDKKRIRDVEKLFSVGLGFF
jgi:trk system potassium uptake protein TrkA